MKILFSMRHAGALRNFGSSLEELARRGHRVHLTFLTRDKLDDDRLLNDLRSRYPAITGGGIVPVSLSRWSGLARHARAIGDFVRYRAPEFAQAHALRARAELRVPVRLRSWLRLPLTRWRTGRRWIARVLAAVECALPADATVTAEIRANQPDLVLVTPLVDLGSDQIEYVKAARRLGIRTGLCVHSWDNLTTKGLIRLIPDRIFVWNDVQRGEAVRLHGAAEEQIAVTGAPVYDQWFERRPTSTRVDFCSRVGLAADRPFFLYLCSSPFIAPDEIAFIARWIAAVQSAADSNVRHAGILIRPHPSADPGIWTTFDAGRFANVVVWPAGGANPVDVASKDDYFDSMYHSAAAIGINTSAQIEAGIVGRRVYSVRVPECTGTQEETLHFQYLLRESGGLLRMAETLDDHVVSLSGALRADDADAARLREFVRGFVRPAGLDVPATPRLVDAIEALGREPANGPERLPIRFGLLRVLLFPLATLMPAKARKVPSAGTRTVDAGAVVDRRRAGAGA
jgi:hypothetical protein